jgi:ubiquinone/menaquinone biosynthesis C-methylase UbiE
MGLYREQVLPRVIDRVCGTNEMREWRVEVTRGLKGRVVEVGFGSGLNVDLYPRDVELVLAVEPSVVARRLSDRRVARSAVPITHIGLDGQTIPLDDESCDSALCTFTLCTIPDVRQALDELRRVLRPGPGSTSWSTASPPTPAWLHGNVAWSRSKCDLPTAVTSPGSLRLW